MNSVVNIIKLLIIIYSSLIKVVAPLLTWQAMWLLAKQGRHLSTLWGGSLTFQVMRIIPTPYRHSFRGHVIWRTIIIFLLWDELWINNSKRPNMGLHGRINVRRPQPLCKQQFWFMEPHEKWLKMLPAMSIECKHSSTCLGEHEGLQTIDA